jgi:hypothetical protein
VLNWRESKIYICENGWMKLRNLQTGAIFSRLGKRPRTLTYRTVGSRANSCRYLIKLKLLYCAFHLCECGRKGPLLWPQLILCRQWKWKSFPVAGTRSRKWHGRKLGRIRKLCGWCEDNGERTGQTCFAWDSKREIAV